jgi:hypothetical protein
MIKLKDIIKESNRLNLFEQAKTYKSHEMRGTFMANYVTPNQGWEKDFAPIIKAIQELVNKNYKLDQINVVIRSGASKDQASNRYQGAKPPKHNFQTYIPTGTPTGGLLPAAGWVPASGTRIGIPDGNAFLAAERGRQLKAKIEPSLKSKFPKLPSNFIILNPKLNSQQFASYQVQTTGEPKVEEDVPKYMGAGAYQPDEGGTGDGLSTRRFSGTNWPSLAAEYKIWAADPSKAPADVLRRSNKQFGIYLTPSNRNTADFGLGPGVPVPLTKELAHELFKLKIPGRWLTPGWLNSYGGTWQDYAIEQYILAKAGKLTGTPEDIVAKNSSVINADGTAKGYPGLEINTSGPRPKGIQWHTLNNLQKGKPGREKTGVEVDKYGNKLQQ